MTDFLHIGETLPPMQEEVLGRYGRDATGSLWESLKCRNRVLSIEAKGGHMMWLFLILAAF